MDVFFVIFLCSKYNIKHQVQCKLVTITAEGLFFKVQRVLISDGRPMNALRKHSNLLFILKIKNIILQVNQNFFHYETEI